MTGLRIVRGNLLKAEEQYIAHQTNCVTNRSAHLSKSVFDRFPHADIYTNRKKHSKPGTIVVRGDGEDERFVINMLGQTYPGKPRYVDGRDGYLARERFFCLCLQKIAEIPDLKSVAFPYGIGCGAAGGDWPTYRSLLRAFTGYMTEIKDAEVVIYRLEDA